MEKTKVKIIAVTIGRYDYDSITVKLDGVETEICFNKRCKVSQYDGKEVYLSKKKGLFIITPIETRIKETRVKK